MGGDDMDTLVPGKYRVTLSYAIGTPKTVTVPYVLDVPHNGVKVTVTKYAIDTQAKKLRLEATVTAVQSGDRTQTYQGTDTIQVLPIAVPVSAILLAFAIVIGLGVVYLSIDKVEQITSSPQGSILIYGIAVLAILAAWRFFRHE